MIMNFDQHDSPTRNFIVVQLRSLYSIVLFAKIEYLKIEWIEGRDENMDFLEISVILTD